MLEAIGARNQVEATHLAGYTMIEELEVGLPGARGSQSHGAWFN